MEVTEWFRKGLSSPGMSSAIGALDDVFNPAAARARDLLQADHERQVPTPSPGDRLLDDRRIVITQTPTKDEH